MEVFFTLMIRRRVKAPSYDAYEEMRDEIIERMEENGWQVDLEAEDTSHDDNEWDNADEVPMDMDQFSK